MRDDFTVAVVTGASSGIGAELSRQLGALGVKVGLTARRADRLHGVAAEVEAAGGSAAVETTDALDREATIAAIRRLAERLGPVDLLIANAGVGLDADVSRFSSEAIERMLRVNVVGPASAIEAVLPEMLARRSGRIVGISSLAGYRGLPKVAGYSASKAALTNLLEGLRAELSGTGVSVTAVHPGYVRTPMIEGGNGPRPFVMEVGPAARRILRGASRRSRRVDFPAPMAALMGIGRVLPGFLFEPIARRFLGRG